MTKLTFSPIGNTDCCRVDVASLKFLSDYAHCKCAEDPEDKRIDLPAELRHDLEAERSGRAC